jgi:prolipoprotein diacylglyceryltransferase
VWLGVSRLGCFAAGCDAGRVTDAAWAMRFGPHTATFRDHAARGLVLPTDAASLAVHPAQLYEATAAFAIAFAAHRLRLAPGRTALVAAASYALARSVIELFRDDPAPALGTSLAVLLACIALFSGARLASARPAA